MPDRFVVIDVMFVANAVIVTASQLSVLIVGVAEDDIEVTRGVMRLFVSVCVESVPTTVVVAPGNVIVVPSVPARVKLFDTDSDLPLVMIAPRYWLFQLAAVVGVATTAVKMPDVPPARIVIVLAPEDSTVTAPVLWLIMWY